MDLKDLITKQLLAGAIIGAILGSIVVPCFHGIIRKICSWWRMTRPAQRLLQGICVQEEKCIVCLRDYFLSEEGILLSRDPSSGDARVPNVKHLWADVEAQAVANFYHVLGQVGRGRNIQIVRASEDRNEWNCHVVILGSQFRKATEFQTLMHQVSFRVDADQIIDLHSGSSILRENGYGYGVIQKAINPFRTPNGDGIAFNIGGFGVLGAAAAAYYFRQHFRDLGKEFGSNCFGIVVRAPVSGGVEAVQRLAQWDRVHGDC
ncbi:MAG: hypothetical protein WC674_05045 [Candidatus Krumholzibacteriia bacterium]